MRNYSWLESSICAVLEISSNLKWKRVSPKYAMRINTKRNEEKPNRGKHSPFSLMSATDKEMNVLQMKTFYPVFSLPSLMISQSHMWICECVYVYYSRLTSSRFQQVRSNTICERKKRNNFLLIFTFVLHPSVCCSFSVSSAISFFFSNAPHISGCIFRTLFL